MKVLNPRHAAFIVAADSVIGRQTPVRVFEGHVIRVWAMQTSAAALPSILTELARRMSRETLGSIFPDGVCMHGRRD